jgi:predicted ATPase
MEEILQPDKESRQQRQVVLGGMGGIGKTQLAIAYAKLHNDAYTSIFWLNATSEITVKTSLKSIVQCFLEVHEYERLNDEQMLLRVRRWLSDLANRRWLLIFDNYDDPELFDIRQYYSHTAQGSIIITTRLPELVDGTRVYVQPLERVDDSLQILATKSQRQNIKIGNTEQVTTSHAD